MDVKVASVFCGGGVGGSKLGLRMAASSKKRWLCRLPPRSGVVSSMGTMGARGIEASHSDCKVSICCCEKGCTFNDELVAEVLEFVRCVLLFRNFFSFLGDLPVVVPLAACDDCVPNFLIFSRLTVPVACADCALIFKLLGVLGVLGAPVVVCADCALSLKLLGALVAPALCADCAFICRLDLRGGPGLSQDDLAFPLACFCCEDIDSLVLPDPGLSKSLNFEDRFFCLPGNDGFCLPAPGVAGLSQCDVAPLKLEVLELNLFI